MINSNASFSTPSSIHMTRSKYRLEDRRYKAAATAGRLYPLPPIEVLPGATFGKGMNIFARMTPTVNVPLDDIKMSLYWFYVPNRIVWDGFANFLGETEHWNIPSAKQIPQITFNQYVSTYGNMMPMNTVLSSMGICGKIDGLGSVNALPVRGYNMIWNEYFRNQSTTDPLLIYKGDTNTSWDYQDSTHGGALKTVSRFHDYFSSCLPSPQTGEAVKLPISEMLYSSSLDSSVPLTSEFLDSGNQAIITTLEDQIDDLQLKVGTISQLRIAYSTQLLLETINRSGHRYRELLHSLYHVDIRDERAQIPEYLGGEDFYINMTTVAQTSATTTSGEDASPKASVSGLSQTQKHVKGFVKSFTEHGYIIPVYCIRTHRSYASGIDRHWLKKDFLDYYNPLFENVGDMAVYKEELFGGSQGGGYRDVFGYQEAWADYRQGIPRLCNMPENIGKYWTYADYYVSKPTLSHTWMDESATNLNRNLAISGNTDRDPNTFVPQFIIDFQYTGYVVQPMNTRSIPGLSDHF